MSNIFNSASTKPQEELSSSSIPQLDMNVLTKEPSLVDNNEDVQFVLEIEDMQSVISNGLIGDSSYNLKPVRKRRHTQSLDEMYSGYSSSRGSAKRVKVTETDELEK